MGFAREIDYDHMFLVHYTIDLRLEQLRQMLIGQSLGTCCCFTLPSMSLATLYSAAIAISAVASEASRRK